MSLVVDTRAVLGQLEGVTRDMGSGPVLVHTDLLGIGVLDGWDDREALLDRYHALLEAGFGEREVVLPTFNYDFCRSGVYDVLEDPCQVGDINEHVRLRRPDQRTFTPVFNFVILRRDAVNLAPVENVFGRSSTFGTVDREEGTVAFLGAPFETNTFLHYVEELREIGYRYPKRFTGHIRSGDDTRSFAVTYRVRPLEEDVVEYDWPRLIRNLEEDGLLRRAPVGNGEILWYRASALRDHWLQRMKEDEFYLLTEASREAVSRLGDVRGYPFTLDNLEP